MVVIKESVRVEHYFINNQDQSISAEDQKLRQGEELILAWVFAMFILDISCRLLWQDVD